MLNAKFDGVYSECRLGGMISLITGAFVDGAAIGVVGGSCTSCCIADWFAICSSLALRTDTTVDSNFV